MKKFIAKIKLFSRKGNKFVSEDILILSKPSIHGEYILVSIPSLAMETIAKDENDIITAINEAICSFCIVAQKFGKGIEQEMLEIKNATI